MTNTTLTELNLSCDDMVKQKEDNLLNNCVMKVYTILNK